MTGTKFLSELVDISNLHTQELNIIEAPTGSGKSYFALNYIPSLVDDPYHKIVYLIDTRNGKEQIIDNYEVATPEYWSWYHDIFGMNFTENKNVVVMTYAKFGIHCCDEPTFPDCFDYIICDELPSLIKFENFSAKPNFHSVAKQALERAVKNNNTKVIALTATPQSLNKFYTPKFIVPINKDELIQYDVLECVPFTNIDNIIADVDADEVGMCYTSRIRMMLEIERKAKERGLHPVCIWSTANTDHPMTEEQLAVRNSILKDFTLPKEYDFLIINSSSETSLKIKSHIDYVIVNSSNVDTQIQVRGRVNNDLKKLYLPFKKGNEIDVPEKYLGVKLFSDDKRELCKFFGIRDPRNGREWKWRSVKRLLLDLDYNITEGRKHNLRYVIITKA